MEAEGTTWSGARRSIAAKIAAKSSRPLVGWCMPPVRVGLDVIVTQRAAGLETLAG